MKMSCSSRGRISVFSELLTFPKGKFQSHHQWAGMDWSGRLEGGWLGWWLRWVGGWVQCIWKGLEFRVCFSESSSNYSKESCCYRAWSAHQIIKVLTNCFRTFKTWVGECCWMGLGWVGGWSWALHHTHKFHTQWSTYHPPRTSSKNRTLLVTCQFHVLRVAFRKLVIISVNQDRKRWPTFCNTFQWW